MPMTRRQSRKQGQRLRNSHGNLNESNVQQQLLNNQLDTAAHERDAVGRARYRQYHEEAQGSSLEGGINHLLILAQSAEIAAQSENSFAGVYMNNQNTGVQRRSRLTQFRKQARQNLILLNEEKSKDSHCQQLDGEAIRLNQMKHIAQCKDTNDLSSREMVIRDKIEQLPGNMVRLGHIKHLARLKGQSTGKERHIEGHLHCNKSEGKKKVKLVDRQFGKEVTRQTEGHHIKVASGKGQKRIRPKSSNLPVFQTAAAAAPHDFPRGIDHPSAGMYGMQPGMHASVQAIYDLHATNSETQKESMKVRLRLTKLRCEARQGNPSSVMQRLAEN